MFALEQTTNAQRGGVEVQLYSCFNLGARWGRWSTSSHNRFTPPGKKRYLLYRRLGGLQGRSGRVRKILGPLGFYSRIVEPLASHCTDWAIPAHVTLVMYPKLFWKMQGSQTSVWPTAGRGPRAAGRGPRAAGSWTLPCDKVQQTLLMVDALSHICMKYRVTIGLFYARLPRHTRYVHHCTSLGSTPLAF